MKVVKRILIGLGIFILVVVIAAVVIAATFEKKIGSIIVNEVKKSFTTEFKADESSLSLLKSFPKASFELDNVELKDAFGGNLLEAKRMSFKLGLFSLLSSKINLEAVVIEDGALYILTDKRGRANYNVIAKKESKGKKKRESALSLNKAELKDIEAIYINEKAKQEFFWRIDELSASGEFSQEHFSLDSDAKIFSGFIELEDGRYLNSKNLAYDAVIDVDMKNGSYDFNEVEFMIEKNKFRIDGTIEEKKDDVDFDLIAQGLNCSLQSLVEILPEKYQNQLADFKSKGSFKVKSKIKGLLGKDKMPLIDASLSLKNGQITSPRLDAPLKDVTFNAVFNNGENDPNKKEVLQIKDFKGELNDSPIDFQLKITDIGNPKIDFKGNGEMPLKSMHKLLGREDVTDGAGTIKLSDLSLKGYYKDIIDPKRIYKVENSGKISFEDAMVKLKGEELKIEKGSFSLLKNELKIRDLVIKGAGSNLELEGNFRNIVPVFFADSLNEKDASLGFDAKIVSKELDFDRVLGLFAVDEDKTARVSKATQDSVKLAATLQRERLIGLLDGRLFLECESFNYQKIEGDNFKGSLEFKDSRLNFRQITVEAMDGDIEVNGRINFTKKPDLKAYIDGDKLNIKEVFKQTNNFDQDYLTDKNLKGKVDLQMLVRGQWDEKGVFQQKKLYSLVDMKIKNGELINFEMLDQFSKFVKIRDLKHIKFTDIRNQLEIKNGELIIPAMFIQSNALNITLNGKHSFKNDMLYKLKVNAGQVLWNKMKKHNPDMKPKKAKKKGFWNMYFVIEGDLDDYKFSKDKKRVKKELNDELERAYKKINNDLKKEFSSSPIEEPSDWNDDGSGS